MEQPSFGFGLLAFCQFGNYWQLCVNFPFLWWDFYFCFLPNANMSLTAFILLTFVEVFLDPDATAYHIFLSPLIIYLKYNPNFTVNLVLSMCTIDFLSIIIIRKVQLQFLEQAFIKYVRLYHYYEKS